MTDHFFYLPPWLINNRWWDHFASYVCALFLWKACSQEIFLGSGHQCNDIFFYRGVKNCQLITQSLSDFRSFQLVFGEWASTYNCFPDCDVFRTFHGHQDIKLCYLAYAWVHSRSLSHSIFPELHCDTERTSKNTPKSPPLCHCNGKPIIYGTAECTFLYRPTHKFSRKCNS